jgi:sulfur carrier protein ThiS
MKKNPQVEAGNCMVQLDESNWVTVKAILADTETTGRTVILQKEVRVVPIYHPVDRRPEKEEKP